MRIPNLILIFIVLIVILGTFSYVLFAYLKNVNVPRGNLETIVKNSGGSAMLVAECANKSYIHDNADVILMGNVEKIETEQEEGQIYTYSSIFIEKFEKGNLDSNILTIITPGGCVELTCVVVEDQPILHENKLVKIYLKQIEDEFSIFCGIAGVENIGE